MWNTFENMYIRCKTFCKVNLKYLLFIVQHGEIHTDCFTCNAIPDFAVCHIGLRTIFIVL